LSVSANPSAPPSAPSRPPGDKLSQPPGDKLSQPPGDKLSQPPGDKLSQPPGDKLSQPPSQPLGAEHAFHPLDLRRARNRLSLAITIGLVTYAVLGFAVPGIEWPVRGVAAWNAGAVALLCLAWSIIWRSGTGMTRRRAAAADPGRNTVSALVLGASSVSLFAAAVVLRKAKTLAPGQEASLVALCLAAVVSAWCLTHTVYTLRYAHLYYRDEGEGEGGLTFPGERPPDYFDFAYFSFTVGMCFQVSDVLITTKQIRRAVLFHSVLSFAYNTAILALAMNLVAGLLG
jgi:uncharacterized membrane protein